VEKKNRTNFSTQRNAILEAIYQSEEHLSAEEILQISKKKKPSINLATIYRNLQKLEDLNLISRVHINGITTRYEKIKPPHHHFICSKCHSIKDLETPKQKTCLSCISRNSDVQMQSIISTIIGICPSCQNSTNHLPSQAKQTNS
jgi:Fe2+ or Zn2+ uptake regulation protein